MAIYRVAYASMTARYGPSYIPAESELEAKRIFAGTAFSSSEFGCITAREVTEQEMTRALRQQSE